MAEVDKNGVPLYTEDDLRNMEFRDDVISGESKSPEEWTDYFIKQYGDGSELMLDTPETPQKSNYVQNTEWFNQYFPTVSKEEEAKRIRKAQFADKVGRYSAAAAALGNAIGTWNGATAADVPEWKPADLQTWRDKWQQQRQQRAVKESVGQMEYEKAMAAHRKSVADIAKYNQKIKSDLHKRAVADATKAFINQANLEGRLTQEQMRQDGMTERTKVKEKNKTGKTSKPTERDKLTAKQREATQYGIPLVDPYTGREKTRGMLEAEIEAKKKKQ